MAPVLFFILALQTGLSTLDPEERLVILEILVSNILMVVMVMVAMGMMIKTIMMMMVG